LGKEKSESEMKKLILIVVALLIWASLGFVVEGWKRVGLRRCEAVALALGE
jgi:hypothetical protein